MYLGVVPIVKDSVATRYFAHLGLPMWIVRSWDELLLVNTADLEAKYEELKPGFASTALFMDYWRKLITEAIAPETGRAAGRTTLGASGPTRGGNTLRASLALPGRDRRRFGRL